MKISSKLVLVHIQHAVGKVHKFGKTETGTVEKLHNGFVAQAFQCLLVRHGKDLLHFLQGQDGRKRFAALGSGEAGGGRGFDISSSEMEAEEGTDGGCLPRYGLGIMILFRNGIGKESAEIFALNIFEAGKFAAFV